MRLAAALLLIVLSIYSLSWGPSGRFGSIEFSPPNDQIDKSECLSSFKASAAQCTSLCQAPISINNFTIIIIN